MVELVSLDRVKTALRIGDTVETSGGFEVLPHDDDDILQEVYIPAASELVIKHLKAQAEVVLDLDSGGELPSGAEVPEFVQIAVILLIRDWYDAGLDQIADYYEGGHLPAPVRAILGLFRDPTLA